MMQHNAGETNLKMLTKVMYKNMTWRDSRFYTLDMTGFSLRFNNFRFSLSQKLCALYGSMVTFKHTYFIFPILKQ